MHSRTAVLRYRRRALRTRKRLAVATLLVGAVCAALLMREPVMRASAPYVAVPMTTPAPSTPSIAGGFRSVMAAGAQAADPGPRRIYPYSIVPGGVHGALELARIIQADKVVAQHYAGLRLDEVREVTVARPRAVYVSYRKGDQVYWTAKKLTLKAGETLLTDGSIELRTRCGNMISDTPRLPVEAAGPGEEELDSSVASNPQGAAAEVAYALDADGNQPGSTYRLVNFDNGSGIVGASQLLARSRLAPWAPAAAGVLMPAGLWALAGGTASAAPASPAPTPAPAPAPAPAPEPAVTETSPAPSADVVTNDPAPAPGTTLQPVPVPMPDAEPVPVTEPVLADEKTEPVPAPPDPATLPWPAPLPPAAGPGKDDTVQGEVPEPSTPWLAGGALIAMLLVLRRPRRQGSKRHPREGAGDGSSLPD
jgi:hypothetical protein